MAKTEHHPVLFIRQGGELSPQLIKGPKLEKCILLYYTRKFTHDLIKPNRQSLGGNQALSDTKQALTFV